MSDMTPKQREIVELAYPLFFEGGFHATGVDALMEGSGISKRTLYKYFPSKEHLVEAVLAHYGTKIEDALIGPALARSDDPRDQILALFDVRRETLDAGGCRGCLAMKAAQEYRGRHAAIEATGRQSAEMVEALFISLCARAGIAEPEVTGKQLAMLMHGAVLTAQVQGHTEAFAAARAGAAKLMSA